MGIRDHDLPQTHESLLPQQVVDFAWEAIVDMGLGIRLKGCECKSL